MENEYRFDPLLDELIYGTELKEGMQVIPEEDYIRSSWGGYKGGREQQFAQVTRLRPTMNGSSQFIAVFADGFQHSSSNHGSRVWIRRRPNLKTITGRMYMGEKPWISMGYVDEADFSYSIDHVNDHWEWREQ